MLTEPRPRSSRATRQALTGRFGEAGPAVRYWWVNQNQTFRQEQEEKMHLAGPKDRGWAYTEQDRGIQHGNAGLKAVFQSYHQVND